MKKYLPVIFTFMILAFAGCIFNDDDNGDNGEEYGLVPVWYLNPPESKDKIYGVGASEKTQSLELGKQVADANARTNIANKIQVSVQSMLRTYLQQSGTMETARAVQFAESVSKQVIDIILTGVTISKREVKNGRSFSLAEVSQDSLKNALLSVVIDFSAEYSELKEKQALDDLVNEIDKGNIPIVI